MGQMQDETGSAERAGVGITEFLLARIAEDEDRARDFEQDHALAINGSYSNWDACYGAPAEWKTLKRLGFLPARVLAECAAKRAIVNLYEGHRDNRDARRRPRARAAEDEQAARDRRTQEARCRVAEDAMFSLAAVYADHADYQQEWAL